MSTKTKLALRTDFPGPAEPSAISIAKSPGYTKREMSAAMRNLVESLSPPLSSLIRSGDTVLVKPFLSQMGSSDPDARRTSHPAFIRAVIALVKDCGGRINLGDEGLRPKGDAVPHDRRWLHELASEMGASLVSFAKAGARKVPTGLAAPRHYYLSNAVLDADVLVNCANCLPQDRLLITGAVKNLFNAVIGRCQDRIYQQFQGPEEIARVIVDVYRLTRPAISFLDMTTVREPGRHGKAREIGLILAGRDAVALDAMAARFLGYDGQTLWTSKIGEEAGMGCSSPEGIAISGLTPLPPAAKDFPLPRLETARKSPLAAQVRRTLKNSFLRPRPAIRPQSCNGCGDCVEICPTDAIEHRSQQSYTINAALCVDCEYCTMVCRSHAIQLRPFGLARLWNRAKAGASVALGPVKVSLKVSRNMRVSRGTLRAPRKAAPPGAVSPARPGFRPRLVARTPLGKTSAEVAVVVGTGPGLGSALARRFAAEGMHIAAAARHAEKLVPLIRDLADAGAVAHAYGCDATEERSVIELFRAVNNDLGVPRLVIYNVEHFTPGTILDIEVTAFEDCWKAMCLGGFIVGREAARWMVGRGSGSIVYTGATGALRGRQGYVNLAIGKFGVRALAQVMARELGPKGIHVAHVVIDGGILSHKSPLDARTHMSSLFPEQIAETVYHLYRQHPSAWTHELDLRPWVEKF